MPVSGVFQMGLRPWQFEEWNGEALSGPLLSFDTETELIEDYKVPRMALAVACDGRKVVILRPSQLATFVYLHRDCDWIGHNFAFDFEVVTSHLQSGKSEAIRDSALGQWWKIVEEGRAHDTMILDSLVRLARRDDYPSPRDLGMVASYWGKVSVDKSDTYRMRYGELLGVEDWDSVEPGFFSYAARDAVATWYAWQGVSDAARRVASEHGAGTQWGLLTETIQLKAAIALGRIEKRGFALDRAQIERVETELQDRIDELVKEVDKLCPGYFKRRKPKRGKMQSLPLGIRDERSREACNSLPALLRDNGTDIRMEKTESILRTKSGAPSKSVKALGAKLEEVAREIGEDIDREVKPPLTEKGNISASTKEWEEWKSFHPFLSAWIDLEQAVKTAQFFKGLQGSEVHPRYTTMVRTGRTSCSDPNIQQIPRSGGLREAFIARPGHLLLIIDYAFLELRTLAAVCEAKYGKSVLANVIREGVDPHVYTAALVNAMELDEFKGLKKSNPSKFKSDRQAAKAVNFGVPGGLGAISLSAYAKATYGVEMGIEEAREFRRKLIEEVYPELSTYLSDDASQCLALQLGCRVSDIKAALGDHPASVLGARNIVRGMTHKRDGTPYNPDYIKRVWDGLIAINEYPELAFYLSLRRGSEALARRLFSTSVVTLTGRVRGRVGYSQARNTPFQGLAADGAKLALWRLIREGFNPVAFVHDEVVIEVEEGANHAALARQVEGILNGEMESVCGSVPIGSEYALARCWSKGASAKFDEEGRLIPSA